MSLETLKKRKSFLYVREGRTWVTPSAVLQARKRKKSHISSRQQENSKILSEAASKPRFGFTASKKIGNAVQRNRAKRRLKEAIRRLGLDKGQKPSRLHYDYVLIARQGTLNRDFENILKDMRKAFGQIHKTRENSQTSKASR